MDSNPTFNVMETTNENIGSLHNILQSILDSTFSSQEKRIIKTTDKEFRFACPVCGDSKRNEREKRARIYVNDDDNDNTFLIYRCYNGGCIAAKWSINHFLSYFGKESGNYSITQPENRKKPYVGSPDIASYAVPRKDLFKAFGLVEAIDNITCLRYLKSRAISEIRSGFPNFAYSTYNKSLYMLNTTLDDSAIIGMQVRWADKKYGRFRTWTLSDLHDVISKKLDRKNNLLDDIEKNVLEKADRTSMIYNIMHANLYADKLYIVESTINCHNILSLNEHAVATWGSSNKLVTPNGWYMFDCDPEDADKNGDNRAAGIVSSIESLKNERMTFLWKKFHDEVIEYNNCYDLNEIFVKKPPKSMRELDSYFSNSALDIMYLE
jgi:hypothetical protein